MGVLSLPSSSCRVTSPTARAHSHDAIETGSLPKGPTIEYDQHMNFFFLFTAAPGACGSSWAQG